MRSCEVGLRRSQLNGEVALDRGLAEERTRTHGRSSAGSAFLDRVPEHSGHPADETRVFQTPGVSRRSSSRSRPRLRSRPGRRAIQCHGGRFRFYGIGRPTKHTRRWLISSAIGSIRGPTGQVSAPTSPLMSITMSIMRCTSIQKCLPDSRRGALLTPRWCSSTFGPMARR